MHLGINLSPLFLTRRECPLQEGLQTIQGPVRQRGGDNSSLRSTLLGGEPFRVFEESALQPLLKDDGIHRYMGKKPSMTDVVETAFYVPFKNPIRPIACRHKFETLFNGVSGRAAYSETIRVRVRTGFRDWFQSYQI